MLRIMVLVSLFALSACGEETKSVDWWGEHSSEAQAKKVECDKSGSDSQNCKNVKQALFLKTQKESQPLTFE